MKTSLHKGAMNVSTILGVLVICIVCVAVFFAIRTWQPERLARFDMDHYSAVFLADGQVYFGKLSGQRGQYVMLEDIYYLQVNQQIQPIESEDTPGTPTSRPDLRLVKLGDELHGPMDEMQINHDFVLLTETLRDDSAVVNAIREYKKNEQEGTE